MLGAILSGLVGTGNGRYPPLLTHYLLKIHREFIGVCSIESYGDYNHKAAQQSQLITWEVLDDGFSLPR
jgi:hypothetical protein